MVGIHCFEESSSITALFKFGFDGTLSTGAGRLRLEESLLLAGVTGAGEEVAGAGLERAGVA